ncbi:MAG: bifunctional phosphoserine phosphatase/homoserine phosphotransferase ThrH [Firmicutes bacterium]|nr:bifunctional phosphoserine phosphatase/homoserine phosphotransferase ThrH [Bacillota bacterium]
MDILCLDLEGVLVPEIWIAFSKASGIPELSRTTRDEPDYDKLMRFRLEILKEHGIRLKEIQDIIGTMEPMDGARKFLDEMRSRMQVVILSDTFTQFAMPLMQKLGWPTLFCNTLNVDADGNVVGYTMRCEQSKLTSVRCLQQMGFDTIAAGDSYNDLAMIRASRAGFLFRTTDTIRKANPDLPAFEEYKDFADAIKAIAR